MNSSSSNNNNGGWNHGVEEVDEDLYEDMEPIPIAEDDGNGFAAALPLPPAGLPWVAQGAAMPLPQPYLGAAF